MDTLTYISRRPRVKRELSYYVLHLLMIKAGATFKFESVEKAMIIYEQICALFDRWRTNKYQDANAPMSESASKHIFGTEEYI
jgi:hypothetical protein